MAMLMAHNQLPFESRDFSFSGEALLNPPDMDPHDMDCFLGSLKAKGTRELLATARLWENRLLPGYRGPYFLVRVADIRATLNSSATALILYKEAQRSIEPDPVFDNFLARFEEGCLTKEDEHRHRWSQGIFNQPWNPTSSLRFPIIPISPERMPCLQDRWSSMRKNHSAEQTRQFFRYLCIESNVFELTFLLTPRSVDRLIRHGFEEAAVDYLGESALQDKALIVEILRDTYKALEMIWRVADEPDKLTTEFLCEVHRVCLRTSTILPLKAKGTSEGDDVELKYLNAGVTRQKSRINVIIPGPPRVQFCPFDRVDDELGKFTHLARQWLKNWKKNPFATAAWFHLVIASCHPFEDGNGRVSRLIASIPLVRAGLPPLCIPGASNLTYYDGLHRARDNNYEPLVQCFAEALDVSLAKIEALDSHGDPSVFRY